MVLETTLEGLAASKEGVHRHIAADILFEGLDEVLNGILLEIKIYRTKPGVSEVEYMRVAKRTASSLTKFIRERVKELEESEDYEFSFEDFEPYQTLMDKAAKFSDALRLSKHKELEDYPGNVMVIQEIRDSIKDLRACTRESITFDSGVRYLLDTHRPWGKREYSNKL